MVLPAPCDGGAIALGRIGDSLPTRRVLEFALAHAEAQDAVHETLDAERLSRELAQFAPVIVMSRAADRQDYLQRPDLGRVLAAELRRVLTPDSFDVCIVTADGLSARATATYAPLLVRALRSYLHDLRLAPLVIATQARVALGDEIADALSATLVIMLIGERPGLTSAELARHISLTRRVQARRAIPSAIACRISGPTVCRSKPPRGSSAR